MSKRIVKYKPQKYGFFEDSFYPYKVAYQLSEFGFPNRKFPDCGKISLSVKYKKKRILIPGKIDSKSEDCREYGLCYTYFFIPNNLEKMEKYLTSIT